MTTQEPADRELDQRLEALSRRADPDPALWQAIEARLDQETRQRETRSGNSRWFAGSAIAASIAGALTIGLLLTMQSGDFADENVASAFQRELVAMQASAPAPLSSIRPDAPESLMAAWAENQSAIEELEEALNRDPDNRLLMEFLAQARLRQTHLIQAGITHPLNRSIEL